MSSNTDSDSGAPIDGGGERRYRAHLAYSLVVLGLSVVLAAILLTVLDGAQAALIDHAKNQSSSPEAATGIEYVNQFWTWVPLLVLGSLAIMIIASSVFESRRGP